MWSFTICIVALLAHLGAASFDCRRTSQSCAPSTTCSFTSNFCDCSSAIPVLTGQDCRLVSSKIVSGPCLPSVPCSISGGVCYDDAGTARCYCYPETYGTKCTLKRLAVACETGKMVIGVNPAGATFLGHAYVQGYRAEASCNLTPVPSPALAADSIPDEWVGYALDLANTGTACGDVVAVNSGGRTEYTRNIVVQYERDFLTSADDLFTAKCVFDDSGAFVYSDITKLDTAALTGNLNLVSAETQFSPVSLVLTSGGTTVVSTTPINVGADLLFTFTIPTEYESMRIVTAVANNTDTANLKTLNIVTASCIDAAAYTILFEPPIRGSLGSNKREITLRLKAFHFDGNDKVGFKFTVKVCLAANDADCNPETCDGAAASGFGRKKREAIADEKVITRFITVRDTLSFGQHGQTGLTNSNCQITGQTTAAIVAMGIVMFALLILCVVIIVGFVSQRSRSESKQDLHT